MGGLSAFEFGGDQPLGLQEELGEAAVVGVSGTPAQGLTRPVTTLRTEGSRRTAPASPAWSPGRLTTRDSRSGRVPSEGCQGATTMKGKPSSVPASAWSARSTETTSGRSTVVPSPGSARTEPP